jgi:hypothetical protein
VKTYRAPNKSMPELGQMVNPASMDILQVFSEAARHETFTVSDRERGKERVPLGCSEKGGRLRPGAPLVFSCSSGVGAHISRL